MNEWFRVVTVIAVVLNRDSHLCRQESHTDSAEEGEEAVLKNEKGSIVTQHVGEDDGHGLHKHVGMYAGVCLQWHQVHTFSM